VLFAGDGIEEEILETALLIAASTAFEVGKSSLALVTAVTTPFSAAADGVNPRRPVTVAVVILWTWSARA
jgi:hypothetical protein